MNSQGGLGNDFCLLETSEPMDLDGNNRGIACLPDSGAHVATDSTVAEKCFVAGWGTLSSGGSTPSDLQSVDVNIIADSDCTNAYGNRLHFGSEFCAGHLEGGKDSCQGDSGGPLICVDADNQPVLYGVVSWGFGRVLDLLLKKDLVLGGFRVTRC